MAKLEWKEVSPFGANLCLGGWVLAEAYRIGGGRGGKRLFKWSIFTVPNYESEAMETLKDAQQDLEAKVRRLLAEAGVEVE